MALAKINALIERLAQLPDLNDFCETHYSRLPKHFIGLKQAVNANDLPAICYEIKEQELLIGSRIPNSTDEIVLFVQVSNTEETEAGYTGLIHALEIAGIIVAEINNDQRIGDFFIEPELKIIPIYPRALPFFTVAIQLKIID